MSKRIPELTSFTPASTDSLVVYDLATDTTKRSLLSNLIPSGVNGILFRSISANATGTDVDTAQPWFPTNGGVTLASATSYIFEGYLRTSRAAGTSSHTTSLLFGGTAVLTSVAYRVIANSGDVVTNGTANQTAVEVATGTVVKAASTSATEQTSIWIRGIVRITTTGTFIPQFKYSAAPGGVPTILANTTFTLFPIGADTVTTKGTWS